ncbi:Polyadenylate-binding protein 1 [Mycena chlorophos]|uniref:Polyadenylate-binding protein 1 n=1 Tax=Mycena chlorophos TaxID=658473 RepID=A0A8H6TUA3_MYCCL|nr:Polyadenylate-binding protein 1 [Mycena chlorophos]
MKAHPFLSKPVLFVDFIRLRVSEDQIRKGLLTLVKPRKKTKFSPRPIHRRYSAEKALALVHLQPVSCACVEPLTLLEFSVWPPTRTNAPSVEEPTARPRLIKPWVEGGCVIGLFNTLRAHGPIHTIRADPTTGALIQFWHEEDAKDANGAFLGSQKERRLQVCDSCSVFCANLDLDMNLATLRSYFENYGTITNAEILRKPRTGKSRGLATISFLLPSQAAAAIKGMRQHEIHWRKILVSYAIVKRSSTAKSFVPVAAPAAVDEQPPIVEPAAVPVVDCERCTQLEGLKGLYEALRDELSEHVKQDRDHREQHDSERANLQNRYDEEIKARHAAEDEGR